MVSVGKMLCFPTKETTYCLLVNPLQRLCSFAGVCGWHEAGWWWKHRNSRHSESGFEADQDGDSRVPLGRACHPGRLEDKLMVGVAP